jgi:hypothetical protein
VNGTILAIIRQESVPTVRFHVYTKLVYQDGDVSEETTTTWTSLERINQSVALPSRKRYRPLKPWVVSTMQSM